ncbi:MAG: pirin family protein, partial [Bacteroidia bacterium]|nr:pirin family protein [Bacteroidia bacterium]
GENSQISNILLLSGKPINEPVVTYGPFVMNSEEEIKQAYADYQQGKMGKIDF